VLRPRSREGLGSAVANTAVGPKSRRRRVAGRSRRLAPRSRYGCGTTPDDRVRSVTSALMAASGSSHYSSPRQEMLRFIPEGASTLLDIGCSTGAFGRELKLRSPRLEVHGVEVDALRANEARAVLDHVTTGHFPDVADTLGVRTFDVVVMNDVLEHMATPDAALAAAHTLVKDDGLVVASIPNVRHFSVWAPLVIRGDWRYEDDGLLDRTHLRFFTRRTMVELFENAGWAVHRVTGINRSSHSRHGGETLAVRATSKLSLRRADPFLFVQYVVEARKPA
jgi:2-polyprenyl-3-methyl-5-hydroxy-6-metoxy-1,4-benzoquinol methylase